VLFVAPAVKDHHEVTVTFQLPCLRQHYTSKPDHYISHLVGHEGPGSLLAALKVCKHARSVLLFVRCCQHGRVSGGAMCVECARCCICQNMPEARPMPCTE
jgi:secreted Zn-dependent insulinase-like peptidase